LSGFRPVGGIIPTTTLHVKNGLRQSQDLNENDVKKYQMMIKRHFIVQDLATGCIIKG